MHIGLVEVVLDGCFPVDDDDEGVVLGCADDDLFVSLDFDWCLCGATELTEVLPLNTK